MEREPIGLAHMVNNTNMRNLDSLVTDDAKEWCYLLPMGKIEKNRGLEKVGIKIKSSVLQKVKWWLPGAEGGGSDWCCLGIQTATSRK